MGNGYFNSIKVRLEHEFAKGCLLDGVFQFHKGTIRTLYAYYSHTRKAISIP